MMIALSVRQPWAWLIVNGYKDIENRNWYTVIRGPVLIHASSTVDMHALNYFRYISVQYSDWIQDVHPDMIIAAKACAKFMNNVENRFGGIGGIVGYTRIIDCVEQHESCWFEGKYGFVLKDSRPLNFTPIKGQLKFFSIPDTLYNNL